METSATTTITKRENTAGSEPVRAASQPSSAQPPPPPQPPPPAVIQWPPESPEPVINFGWEYLDREHFPDLNVPYIIREIKDPVSKELLRERFLSVRIVENAALSYFETLSKEALELPPLSSLFCTPPECNLFNKLNSENNLAYGPHEFEYEKESIVKYDDFMNFFYVQKRTGRLKQTNLMNPASFQQQHYPYPSHLIPQGQVIFSNIHTSIRPPFPLNHSRPPLNRQPLNILPHFEKQQTFLERSRLIAATQPPGANHMPNVNTISNHLQQQQQERNMNLQPHQQRQYMLNQSYQRQQTAPQPIQSYIMQNQVNPYDWQKQQPHQQLVSIQQQTPVNIYQHQSTPNYEHCIQRQQPPAIAIPRPPLSSTMLWANPPAPIPSLSVAPSVFQLLPVQVPSPQLLTPTTILTGQPPQRRSSLSSSSGQFQQTTVDSNSN